MISRHRSKSSLGLRPSDPRSPPAETSSQFSRSPSNIPIFTGRSVSPNRSPQPSPGKSYSPKLHAHLAVSNDNRNSLDLDSGAKIREGFIKNELPPFRVLPDEAMRIAEKGHDIDDDGADDDQYSLGLTSEEEAGETAHDDGDDGGAAAQAEAVMVMEKRKRAETIKTTSSVKKIAPGGRGSALRTAGATRKMSNSGRPSTGSTSSNKITGLPRSGTSLGLGRPSTAASRRVASGGASVSGSGSGTTRSSSFVMGSLASQMDISNTRSASMNVLASNARDQVPLSAVRNNFAGDSPVDGADRDDQANDSMNSTLSPNSTMSSKGLNPSFIRWDDPNLGEPDNNVDSPTLRHPKSISSLRSKRSRENMSAGSSLAPPLPSSSAYPNQLDPQGHHSLRARRSGENIQSQFTSAPPRMTLGHPTNLSFQDSNRSTPMTPDRGDPLSRHDSPEKGGGGVSRKSSVLQKEKSPVVSRQPSSSDTSRASNQQQSGRGSGRLSPQFFVGRPRAYGDFDGLSAPGRSGPIPVTPGTTHMIQGAAYRDEDRGTTGGMRGTGGQGRNDWKTKAKDKDEVGKGCGCIIM